MTAPHVWGSAPDFIGPRHELRESLLMRAALAASPGRRVLNAGAGQGTFTEKLQQRGFEVVSTELGQPALESLRERVRGEVVEADVTALPFADASFDLVVLGEVLEHVEDDRTAVAETARVLRDGGVLAVSVPRNPAWFAKSDEWAGHYRRYTRHELVELVAGADFRAVVCRPWGFPISSLYHRTVYERAVARGATSPPGGFGGPALALLGVLLQVDRLCVGVEPGALGYLLTGRRAERGS